MNYQPKVVPYLAAHPALLYARPVQPYSPCCPDQSSAAPPRRAAGAGAGAPAGACRPGPRRTAAPGRRWAGGRGAWARRPGRRRAAGAGLRSARQSTSAADSVLEQFRETLSGKETLREIRKVGGAFHWRALSGRKSCGGRGGHGGRGEALRRETPGELERRTQLKRACKIKANSVCTMRGSERQ